MLKLLLLTSIILFSCTAYSQDDFFVFKKKNKIISRYRTGSFIVFQLRDGQWVTGNIIRIHNDSFYLRPQIIRYTMSGPDTSHYGIMPLTFADVYAMPDKGLKIDFINGSNRINKGAGHIHFYWVKSGWLFRTGAIGYAALNIINGIIKNDFSKSGKKLGVAAVVFSIGEVLHFSYKLIYKTGKKYHFETVKLAAT